MIARLLRHFQHALWFAGITFFVHPSSAQFAVLPIGGDALGPDGSASYSVGLPAYQHYRSAILYVQEGVQQPNLPRSTRTANPAAISLQLYPNPATEQLFLHFPSDAPEGLHYRIIDTRGRTVQVGRLSHTAAIPSIDLRALPNGLYQLQIYRLQKGQSSAISYHSFIVQNH